MRRVIAALIVVGLAVGVLVLWPRPVAEENVDSEALGSATTTSDVVTTTTTTGTTSTTGEESHVVETVEEAEEILRELWFGWFEGIYNQDEDRIREVVVTQQKLETALNATLNFRAPPTPSGLVFDELEILRSDEDCLAVWTVSSSNFIDLDTETSRSGVDILRWSGGRWRFATAWVYRDDLWEADCEAVLLPLP
jgi:hypothetical protein